MKSTIMGIALVLVLYAPARGAVLDFQCESDSLRVSVWLFGDNPDPTGLSVSVRARVVGSCEPAVVISPEPIPFPPLMTYSSTQFTVPTIDTGRYLSLEIFGVDAAGHEFPVGDSGDGLHYDMGACSVDAVFGRGHIVEWGGQRWLDPCSDHCWAAMALVFVDAEPGWESFVNSDTIVNVYGRAFIDGMPPGPYFLVSRVAPELDPAGCNAIGTEVSSWGSLKSMYR